MHVEHRCGSRNFNIVFKHCVQVFDLFKCKSNRLWLLSLRFVVLSLSRLPIVIIIIDVLVLKLEILLLAPLPLILVVDIIVVAVCIMIYILLSLHVLIHLHLLLHLLLLLLFLLLFLLVALGLLVSALSCIPFLVAAAPHRFGVDQGLGRRESLDLRGLVVHLGRCQLTLLCNLLDFLICKAKVDVFWFQIGVDNITDTMEIV